MTKSRYYKPALAALFAALTAIGAFIQVPLGFTSITLQTMFTILAGLLLGAKWGALSQIVYVVLGLAGLPIFTKGGGPGYFLQPSMGFLLALIPAAFAAGLIAEKMERGSSANSKGSIAPAVTACIIAEIIMYAIGTPYMGFILNSHMGLGYSASRILKAGCLIYLPGDLVKCIAAIAVYMPVKRALKSSGLLPKQN